MDNFPYFLDYYNGKVTEISDEVKNVYEIVKRCYDESDAIEGYNPYLRWETFMKCQELLPDYVIRCVAEQTGVEISSIIVYKK